MVHAINTREKNEKHKNEDIKGMYEHMDKIKY